MEIQGIRSWVIALGLAFISASCAARTSGIQPAESSSSVSAAVAAPSQAHGGVSKSSPAGSRPKRRLAIDLDPARFVVRERQATYTSVFDGDRKRLLEFHMLDSVPCDKDSIPKIGRITATNLVGAKRHADLTMEWFTQRSSVEHTPMTASGFFVCSAEKFVVVRCVGEESTMADARADLDELLAGRKIILE